MMTDLREDGYDVVVIGGGAAGLGGALTLARARRAVLVIDSGTPRNAPAAGVHGLLGLDGIPPAELLARGRTEVRGYGGQLIRGQAAAVTRTGAGFGVQLADGREIQARRVLVASGLADELPGIPGLAEQWGHGVMHCPYCHGWEVRDRAIGVLASGPLSVHQALLVRQWSADVMYFAHTMPRPDGEQARELAARGIEVVDGEVTSVLADGGRLTGVRLAGGTDVPREVLAVSPRMIARAGFLAPLGLVAAEHPSGAGEHIPTDPAGRTAVPGVWAAGNVADLSAQVGSAAAAGTFAAAQINADLIAEETRQAVTGQPAAASVPA